MAYRIRAQRLSALEAQQNIDPASDVREMFVYCHLTLANYALLAGYRDDPIALDALVERYAWNRLRASDRKRFNITLYDDDDPRLINDNPACMPFYRGIPAGIAERHAAKVSWPTAFQDPTVHTVVYLADNTNNDTRLLAWCVRYDGSQELIPPFTGSIGYLAERLAAYGLSERSQD